MPSHRPIDRFIQNLRRVDYTRKRMEELYSQKDIALRDLDAVYEALFLRAVTSFEVFLEDQFIAIVGGRANLPRGRASPRMTATSAKALSDILLQGDAYMVWLPFLHTERRAHIYLKDGKPFSDLTDGDKSMIRYITIIRNAIAHRGSHAMNEFGRVIIGSQSLLRAEKTPAGFLRSRVRTGPTRNRFEVYTGELARIARTLC